MAKSLSKGSRGADVKSVQKRLHLIEDGIFGPLTEEAVKEFQKDHGLTADGIVGPATKQALGISPATSRRIDKIIVHCTATPEGLDYTVALIRECHLARGFSDIGYHFVIYRDGTIHRGRDINKSGAHTSGQNAHSIGISYVGGCPDKSDPNWMHKGKDTRTAAQKVSLIYLIRELKAQYGDIPVYGHCDFANKLCPCFDAKKEYASL